MFTKFAGKNSISDLLVEGMARSLKKNADYEDEYHEDRAESAGPMMGGNDQSRYYDIGDSQGLMGRDLGKEDRKGMGEFRAGSEAEDLEKQIEELRGTLESSRDLSPELDALKELLSKLESNLEDMGEPQEEMNSERELEQAFEGMTEANLLLSLRKMGGDWEEDTLEDIPFNEETLEDSSGDTLLLEPKGTLTTLEEQSRELEQLLTEDEGLPSELKTKIENHLRNAKTILDDNSTTEKDDLDFSNSEASQLPLSFKKLVMGK